MNASARLQAVNRVLWVVLALNLAVVAVKFAVGVMSGALAVIADAFHSVVDSSSNVIGLLGMWVAARPADANHPYGHRKYETVATLAIGGMLLVASFEIARGVLERLEGQSAPPEVSALTIGLMAATFAVNLAVTVYESRAGRRLQSDILLADAMHTRADLFVTLSVIGALVGGRLGLPWLDPLVAGGVVILLARAAFGILYSATQVLTDVAVADPEQVRRIALSVPGVHSAADVRSRGRADEAFLELSIRVHPAMDADQAHNLATEVERRIGQALPGVVQTSVHVEPGRVPEGTASPWENIAVQLRGLADGLGVGLHELNVHAERDGSYSIEVHVEVPAELSLGQAHDLVDEFEQRIRQALPPVRDIVSHIEPLPADVPDEAGDVERVEQLCRRVVAVADAVAGAGASHNVEVHNLGGHLCVTLHVTQPADQPLVKSHALAEMIERQLMTGYQRFQRVVVHVEPPE